MPLETVDLDNVEILAAGERVWGRGSPPEGDVYTEQDRARIATASGDAPVKIGHSAEQRLAKASGLVDEAGAPALGRLANYRVVGNKLVADLKRVPKQLAELIPTAFGKRSAELDAAGRVRGLAVLGATLPAFKTLADITALYQEKDADAAMDTVLRCYEEDAHASVEFAPLSVRSENADASDTRGVADEPTKDASAELLRQYADALGVEGEATSDQILEHLAALVAKHKAAEERAEELEKAQTDQEKQYAARFSALEQRLAAGEGAANELRERKRDDLLRDAMSEGRIPPAARDEFARMYDEQGDEATRRVLNSLPPNESMSREYGSDSDGRGSDDELERLYAATFGQDSADRTKASS